MDNKTNLLLLHGALGSKGQFERLTPLLATEMNVHTLDFEGHGNAAPKNRPFRTEHFVENLLDYVDENELAAVDIFGYSMGGHVALCFCLKHPERVRRVFTFATKFHWTPETAAREAAHLDAEIIAAKAPRFALDLEKRHPASGWKEVLAKTKDMTLRQGQEGLLEDSALQEITHLIRVSVGDSDKMVSIEETTDVYRRLPAAQLQVFPSTSHHLDQTDLRVLANAMNSFFTG